MDPKLDFLEATMGNKFDCVTTLALLTQMSYQSFSLDKKALAKVWIIFKNHENTFKKYQNFLEALFREKDLHDYVL